MLDLIHEHRAKYRAELEGIEQELKATADRKRALGAKHMAVCSKLEALNALASDLPKPDQPQEQNQ